LTDRLIVQLIVRFIDLLTVLVEAVVGQRFQLWQSETVQEITF
jgi:hypothetical protein